MMGDEIDRCKYIYTDWYIYIYTDKKRYTRIKKTPTATISNTSCSFSFSILYSSKVDKWLPPVLSPTKGNNIFI